MLLFVLDTVIGTGWDQAREAATGRKAPDGEVMGDGSGVLALDDLVATGQSLELARSL